MKHFALGWACNLNDIFVRFPYEKCKTLVKNYKLKYDKRKIVKRVFRESISQILDDIIENNVTFKIQGVGYQGGELHFEPIRGEDFERVRKKGKFKDVDFLESLFTGYLLYLYIHGKRDDFLHRRKFPVYMNKILRDKLTSYINLGRVYC